MARALSLSVGRARRGPRVLDVSVIVAATAWASLPAAEPANLCNAMGIAALDLPAGDPTSFSERRTIAVCPFSVSAQNEDKLSVLHVRFRGAVRGSEFGRYASCHARSRYLTSHSGSARSSGGLHVLDAERTAPPCSWTQSSIPSPQGDGKSRLASLFAYHRSRCNEAELREGVKSHYYPNVLRGYVMCVRATAHHVLPSLCSAKVFGSSWRTHRLRF